MGLNKQILSNFNVYDRFLSTLNNKNRKVATSLKMMYAIHIEKNFNNFYMIKQIFRFVLKLIIVPFVRVKLDGLKDNNIIIKGGEIEQYISEKLELSLVEIKRYIGLNTACILIYKKIFEIIKLSFKNNYLRKKYMISLYHRLIDYLLVYETIETEDIRTLLVENDRIPENLALIDKLKENNIKTIKYDNWLIDPINHNDIYCEYYFYPSLYHRKVINGFENNKSLQYIKGGFLYWDKLNSYVYEPLDYVIYFTQFGIDTSTHFRYISDIIEILNKKRDKLKIIVKIHPREDIKKYKTIFNINPNIEVMADCEDIYALISRAKMCFSIFSTISLEAKHIMPNSFFINYNYKKFTLIDYSVIKLDLIKNKNDLFNVINEKYIPIEQELFLKENNCSYPNTVLKLKKVIDNE